MFEQRASSEFLSAARSQKRLSLSEHAAKLCLKKYGVPVPNSVVVSTADEGMKACKKLSAPFAVKGMSQDILHKSDIGAVKIHLNDPAAVARGITEISTILVRHTDKIDGYLVEEMAPPGHEIIIGAIHDPHFGPLVMVGMGGVFVEVFEDIAFGICPINSDDASQMIDALQSSAILAGARGADEADRESIISVMLAIGGENGLMVNHTNEISQIDINPLIVSAAGAVAADARVILHRESMRLQKETRLMRNELVAAKFKPLFEPQTIAVVGASSSKPNRLNNYIKWVRDFGFQGQIYPIHPSASLIDGTPAYKSLGDTPKPVDYAMVGVPAEKVIGVIERGAGNCKFAHVIAAGFGEKGTSEGNRLHDELIAAAKGAKTHILGPNCNGGHSPRAPFTYVNGMASELGTVGCISQSGGLGIDVLRQGETKGIRFSGLMTVGNAVDIGPTDLLEFYLCDPFTKVIGMYIEGLEQGGKFFELLRRNNGEKPVVLLKGGRTHLGQQAAESHTGALAGDAKVWSALERQTGAIMVDTLEEYLDVLLAFQMIPIRPKKPTTTAVIFGNGGGTSVLAVDYFAERGIGVDRFHKKTQNKLASLGLPPGCALNNPIDTPGGSIRVENGAMAERIMEIVYANEEIHAFVMHLNIPVLMRQVMTGQDLLKNLMDGADRVESRYPGRTHFLLVLRSDGRAEMDDKKRVARKWALSKGYPVFDELTNAGNALSAISKHELFCARRRKRE